jgi:hypothetical protein
MDRPVMDGEGAMAQLLASAAGPKAVAWFRVRAERPPPSPHLRIRRIAFLSLETKAEI